MQEKTPKKNRVISYSEIEDKLKGEIELLDTLKKKDNRGYNK